MYEHGLAYRGIRPAMVVPGRQDDPRQRAGRAGPLLALRQRGRPRSRPRAVVLPHHRLCPAAARRPRRRSTGPSRSSSCRPTGSAAARAPRWNSPLRGSRRHAHGLHHAARHALRRHLHGAGARAPAGRRAHRPPSSGAAVDGLPGRGPPRERDRAPLDREGQDRRVHRRLRREPRERRADPHLDQRLRADGLRHRRHHGRAGARRARLRLRHASSACRSSR